SPFFFHDFATVRGRSKTASNGTLPNASKWSHSVRTRVSAFWLSTTVTCTNREYLRRLAKNRIFSCSPLTYSTHTSPKSCWLNSPGSPSSRIVSDDFSGRTDFTSSYAADTRPLPALESMNVWYRVRSH